MALGEVKLVSEVPSKFISLFDMLYGIVCQFHGEQHKLIEKTTWVNKRQGKGFFYLIFNPMFGLMLSWE
jgi:hypothetical protein